jgi:soluble lytic murein transglycosylase-like protein
MRVRKLLVTMSLPCLAVAVPVASAAVSSPTPAAPERAAIEDEALSQHRAAVRRAKRKARPPETVSPQLEAIAQCESGGDPRAIGGGGAYRGKYQFSYGTWASVGGKGDPARASEREQDRRAAMLLRSGGRGHWPVCG